MVNYGNTKIYKIWSNAGDKIYIGSTTKQYLSQRMVQHRNHYTSWKSKKRGYVTSFALFEEYGIENCMIELIEAKECEDKNEVTKLEGHYIRSLDCVNKVIPDRTLKEYRADNKEHIQKVTKEYRIANKEQSKVYYESNKEYFQDYAKEYRESNKEYVKAQQKIYHKVHKEKVKAQKRLYNEVNKELIREQQKAYREVNKEQIKEQRKASYQKRKQLEVAKVQTIN